MLDLARNGYTYKQVQSALHAPNRRLSFRYDLLDKNNNFIRRLDNVISASVSHQALANIKRTARFAIADSGDINYLTDRIKPWVLLKMPDGGYAEFPLGVFLLSTPPRKVNAAGAVTRDIEAYDQTQVLLDDKVTARYTIAAGTEYIAAISAILTDAGIALQNITPSDKVLPADKDWPPGTPKLQIINNLTSAINYRAIWFDENGYAVVEPYRSLAMQASEYTYKDDDESVIFPEVEQSLDLFSVANAWVLVVSEPDQPPLVSTYTNASPTSPTSTINRGRVIVDYREYEEAADQATLNARAVRLAEEASQVYEHVTMETAIMPMHSHADVLTLEFSRLGISAKYGEVGWSMELKAGAKMQHNIRKVVFV
jgi:hypothetical protein